MATSIWNAGAKQSWKVTLSRVKSDIKEDRLSMVAAAMAYYALFSIVPALSSVVLLYAWFSDPGVISGHMKAMRGLVPVDLLAFMGGQLTTLASKAPSSLGAGAILTLLLSLWGASKATNAFIDGLNMIYSQKEDRGFLKYTALSLGLTLMAVILCILALTVVIGFPALTEMLDLGTTFETSMGILSWTVLLGLFSFFLSLAYHFSPNHARRRRREWISAGAVIASVLWAATSGLFSWYAKEFADFNKTYGSLGGAVVLMTWLYLSSFVILLGAEINVERGK